MDPSAHEDAERLEQAMVDYSMHDSKTHREKLLKEHVMDRFLSRIADKSQRLLDLYADHEGYVSHHAIDFQLT